MTVIIYEGASNAKDLACKLLEAGFTITGFELTEVTTKNQFNNDESRSAYRINLTHPDWDIVVGADNR